MEVLRDSRLRRLTLISLMAELTLSFGGIDIVLMYSTGLYSSHGL